MIIAKSKKLRLKKIGDKYLMTGGMYGVHYLYSAGYSQRVDAHWKGYMENNNIDWRGHPEYFRIVKY